MFSEKRGKGDVKAKKRYITSSLPWTPSLVKDLPSTELKSAVFSVKNLWCSASNTPSVGLSWSERKTKLLDINVKDKISSSTL